MADQIDGLDRDDLYLDRKVIKAIIVGGWPGGGENTPTPTPARQTIRLFYDEMTTTAGQVNDYMIPFDAYEIGLPTTIYRNGIKVRDDRYEVIDTGTFFFVRFSEDIPPGTFLSIEVFHLVDAVTEGGEE